MRATEILRREHRWIRLMAECLDALVAGARAQERLAPEAYELLHLYESFADGRHQDKEERVLFPELLARAGEGDRAVLGRLLEDHEGERRQMVEMRRNLFGAVQGERARLREFTHAAERYAELHAGHMEREAAHLLPMAERLLDAEADERVARGFEALEGGAGDPHSLLEQIRRLRKHAGLPTPPAA